GGFPFGVAFDGSHVWVAHNTGPGSVAKLRPDTGAPVPGSPFPTAGDAPSGMASDATHIWPTNNPPPAPPPNLHTTPATPAPPPPPAPPLPRRGRLPLRRGLRRPPRLGRPQPRPRLRRQAQPPPPATQSRIPADLNPHLRRQRGDARLARRTGRNPLAGPAT